VRNILPLFFACILLSCPSAAFAQSNDQPNFVNLVLNNGNLVIACPDNMISSFEKKNWLQYGNDIRMSFNPASKVKPASELTDDDLSGNCVLFLGNAITNNKITGFMKKYPQVAVEGNKLSFGGREFSGKNIFLLVGGPSSVCEKKYFLFGLSSGTLPQISAECLHVALKYDFLIGDQYGVISFGIFDASEENPKLNWKTATILPRPQMKLRTTEHYEFVFPSGTLAEKDITKIERFQEECYEKVCSKLGFKKPVKISFLLYPSLPDRAAFTGHSGNGNADDLLPRVYILYSDSAKCIGSHEITHILSAENWSRKYPGEFLDEGIAEYSDRIWNKKTHREIVRDLLKQGRLPRIIDLESAWNKYQDNISYPVSAAFVAFAIEKYGIVGLKKIYLSLGEDRSKSIEIYLKESPENLQKDFENWIRKE